MTAVVVPVVVPVAVVVEVTGTAGAVGEVTVPVLAGSVAAGAVVTGAVVDVVVPRRPPSGRPRW